jgi:hypothetical protein
MNEEKNNPNRKKLLLELLGSVFTDVHTLIAEGKTAQAAKLAESFQTFPSVINESVEMTFEKFCETYLKEYDQTFEDHYVKKTLMSAYSFPESIEKINEIFPNRYLIVQGETGAGKTAERNKYFDSDNDNILELGDVLVVEE